MSNKNLLPWRQELRDRQRASYLKVLGSVALLACGVVALAYIGIDYLRNAEEDKASYLRTEITKLDEDLREIASLKEKKIELVARMEAINSLQQSRNIAVHLYSDLPSLTATGLYLNDMKFDGNRIFINGLAESNPRVSSMLRNIDNSVWLGNSSIIQTKAEVREGKKVVPTLPDGLYKFQMQFSVTGKNANQGGK